MSILLAFSGGLDTSFCVPYLRETYGEPVYTATIDTGASDSETVISALSSSLGAAKHFHVDAKDQLFEQHLRYLIMGNVLRGGVYPLCAGAERFVQATEVVAIARKINARAIAHGSTGAGNDQVRFDLVIRMLADDLDLITPIREHNFSREYTTAYLRERGHDVPPKATHYSINDGLWGTTIGGKETLGTSLPLPDAAYPKTCAPQDAPDTRVTLEISFKQGIPVAIDGNRLDPVPLIKRLEALGNMHGVGRNIHVGDTILGVKGRLGFEAPAALILITAHKELEKIVLTKWQQYQKNHLADFYGMLLHEGQYFDPVMRDVEAFLVSSQEVVTGDVTVQLYKGHINVQGVESPHSMFDSGVATYGEETSMWDGADARSFIKLSAVQTYLAHKARQNP